MHFETWICLAIAVGVIAAVVAGAAKSAQQRRDEVIQQSLADYEAELTKLTTAQTDGDLFWIRSPIGDPRAVTRSDLLQLYAAGDISLDTEVAHDAPVSARTWRSLRDEIPALKAVRRADANP